MEELWARVCQWQGYC